MRNDSASNGVLGRSTLWSLLNQSAGQILVLVVFLVTARFVSKEAFGIMAACLLIVDMFRQILIESLGTTFAAKQSPTDDEYSAGFHIILFGGITSALLTFALAHPLADFFGHKEIASTLQWISVLLLTAGLSKIHEIWLGKNFNFRMLAIRSVVSICIGGAVGIWMAVHDYGITSLIAQQIVTAVVASVWLWISTPWRPSFKIKFDIIASIVKYTKHVCFGKAVSFASTQSDTFFSAYYLGPALTGVYNAGKRLLTATTVIVSGGLNSVAFPALAAINDEPERQSNAYLNVVFLTSLLTAPLFMGMSVLSADLVGLLMEPKWSDVAPVLSILCISGFFQSLEQYNDNIIFIKDKPHWQPYLAFIGGASNIILLMIFAKNGLIALALAQTAKSFFFYPFTTFLALKLLGLPMRKYFSQLIKPVLSAAIMGGLLFYVRSAYDFGSLLNLIIYVPAGVVLYFTTLFILSPDTVKDLIRHAREMIHFNSAK